MNDTLKTVRGFKLWQILYPIGIYYVASSLAFFCLQLIMGAENETYMLRQMLSSAVTIPFVYSFYKQDKAVEKVVYGEKEKQSAMQLIKETLLAICATAALGIAVNNVIAMTPLVTVSEGFQEANTAFFAGGVMYELLGSCLVIPIAEELLFRGVVYKRLRMLFPLKTAILLSAFLFGILHVNLVQFLYAAVLGMLLAFLVEKTGKLFYTVLGHIAANVVAVIRSETGWLDFSYEADAAGIGFTILMAVVAGILIWYLYHEWQKSQMRKESEEKHNQNTR